MSSKFGEFINEKRKNRDNDGQDLKLKDIADRMKITATYLSDMIKGRRNPPELPLLEILADVLKLNQEEKEIMYDLAGRERNEVSPDLPDYIMTEELTQARIALRKARNKGLDNDFWKQVSSMIDNSDR